jgi:cob(I)alamin adenosyltransferase
VKIYTKGGDRGETSLFGGERVRKDDLRVEAYGTVDELNALLGVALTEIGDKDLRELLEQIQRSLFDLGGELATPGVEEREARGKSIPRVQDADVETLEQSIDRMDEEVEPLRAFVLPGGARGAALLHHARTVCRRAERRVVRLAEVGSPSPVLIRYLNRLSDLLFVAARVVNKRQAVPEPTWAGRKK